METDNCKISTLTETMKSSLGQRDKDGNSTETLRLFFDVKTLDIIIVQICQILPSPTAKHRGASKTDHEIHSIQIDINGSRLSQ